MSAPLVLLCAGGTGGHVFPARALAEELTGRGIRVAFAVDARGRKYLDGLDTIDIRMISAGSTSHGKARFILSLLKSFAESRAIVAELKPAAVVGFGGYPSAPPVFAAQLKGIPTILHESNAVLGLANRLLAPLACKIALSFPLTGAQRDEKTVVTGNPVRAGIATIRDAPYPTVTDTLALLVFGGSLGATSFADIVPHAVVRLAKALPMKLQVAHQAREADIEKVKRIYREAGVDADIRSFFDDVPARMAAAHLMICRGGATTIAETSCAGRPAVYIPYPWHKDQQQLHNAQTLVRAGGGWVIEENALTAEGLAALLIDIVPGKLPGAARAAHGLGRPDAAQALADLVLQNL